MSFELMSSHFKIVKKNTISDQVVKSDTCTSEFLDSEQKQDQAATLMELSASNVKNIYMFLQAFHNRDKIQMML